VIPRERDRERLDSRTDPPDAVDWVGALLGAALIRLTVAGTVLLSFELFWVGQYVLSGSDAISHIPGQSVDLLPDVR
jgi:hypothetical protein